MIPDMGITLGADQLQGQKREQIIRRRNDLAARKLCGIHDPDDVELAEQGREKKDACVVGIYSLTVKIGQKHDLGTFRDLCPLDGYASSNTRAPWQFGKALFGDDTLDGSNGDFNAIFA